MAQQSFCSYMNNEHCPSCHYLVNLTTIDQWAASVLDYVIPPDYQSEASVSHLSVLLHELEGLDESQRLVHAAAHGEVIDGHLPDHALGVNNEQAWNGHHINILTSDR